MELKMIENILNKHVIEAPSMGRSVILADRIDEVADDIRQFLLQQTPMLAAVLIPRKLPCLCYSCPTCGAVFMATALNEEYHNEFDNMQELLNDITDYARKGYAISAKDASEFRLDYCEHLKSNRV